jgi:hypothetical protein
VVATLDGNGIAQLSNQSNVVYISLDRPLAPTLNNAAPAVNAFSHGNRTTPAKGSEWR